MKRTGKILIISFMFLVVIASYSLTANAAETPYLKVGDTLTEDIKAMDLDGKDVILKKALEKEFTIFQFMTTACSACQTELSELLKLQRKIGKDRVDVVSISVDMRGADAVKAYETRYQFGIRYFTDSSFQLPPRLNFSYTPSLFIVDKGGKIVFTAGGFARTRWNATAEEIMSIVK